MNKIKVGVMGLGVMGSNHARVYSDLENADLIAVCDFDQEPLEEISLKYSARKYSDYKEMLENEKLDAVSVCVPTMLHEKIALEAIKRKINVLVEKPISATIEEANIIIRSAKNNDVKLMVGHIERFNPVVVELKKRIANKDLGEIYEVHCSRQSQFPQRIIDVGVIIDLAIHEIDILRYLTNSKVKRVFAETAQRIHSNHEDLLIGNIRFENNILGVINANWLSPKKVREITITGEKGMFVANYLTQELSFYEKEFAKKNVDYKHITAGTDARRQKIKIENQEPLENELNAFLKCISDNTEPLVTGEDGLEALKIAQKFLESSKINEVLYL